MLQSDQDNIYQQVHNPRQKHVQTTNTQLKMISSMCQSMHRHSYFNHHLESNATKYSFDLNYKSVEFEWLMMKSHYPTVLKEVLQVMRELLTTMHHYQLRNVCDRYHKQVMVVRVIDKQGNDGIFWIEDQTGQCKLAVSTGIMWVGMIAAIEAIWQNNMYKLERIIHLTKNTPPPPTVIVHPPAAYRIIILRGPFRQSDQLNDIGIMLLVEVLTKLKTKDKTSIDTIVIMGPLLSINNKHVQECTLKKTYEEQFKQIVKLLHQSITNIYPLAKICFIPSTDDVVSFYPLPQPQYTTVPSYIQNVHYLPNPSVVQLQSHHQTISLSLINYDILKYIDKNKGGRPLKQIIQQNYETYFKQPFLLTNSQQPFDACNLPQFYINPHSDILIISSVDSPPYVGEYMDRLVINVGSLGMDYHVTGKHFISLLTIYDGQGKVSSRSKVEFIHQ